jgi:glutathione S-transferase
MHELHVDFMSQPSRALILLCRLNGLVAAGKVKECLVLVHKKQQRTEEYKKLNPLQQVPCLVERNDDTKEVSFRLPESCAILKYLCQTFQLPHQWYPSDHATLDTKARLEKQAYVDSALHWYHSTLRAGCGGITFHKVVARNVGATPIEAIAVNSHDRLKSALRKMESYWLSGKAFVGGSSPNVADLLFCCELEQLHMLHYATDGLDMRSIMGAFPRVQRWMDDVAQALGPTYQDVHKLLRYAAKKRHEKLTKTRAKL